MAATSSPTGFFKRNWTGAAFIVEALILLVFVAGTLAVLLNIFARSYTVGQASQKEARAILVATNVAETFAASPAEGIFVSTEGDFVTSCLVQEEKTSAGTLYNARISVYSLKDFERDDGEALTANDLVPVYFDSWTPVYELTTARYISGEVG